MGLFKSLFKSRYINFEVDFSGSEAENCLNFVDAGGTFEQWRKLVKDNNWHFKKDEYEKEVQGVSDKYYSLLRLIQSEWSVLYNLKRYTGKQAEEFERMCLTDIGYYIEMRNINIKYNEETSDNVPAFNRLIMLYEKQGEFEKAAVICKKACLLDVDKRAALARMIKKAGRTPTAEEDAILYISVKIED